MKWYICIFEWASVVSSIISNIVVPITSDSCLIVAILLLLALQAPTCVYSLYFHQYLRLYTTERL